MAKKMDRKLIAYSQPYEVGDMARKFKVSKKDFLAIVSLLPEKKRSMEYVEAAMIGFKYHKHPRVRAKQTGATDEGFPIG